MNFVAIDFETAVKHHICSVGIVTVANGLIVDEFTSLIRPPENRYNWYNIQVHHIEPTDTEDALPFDQVYPEIRKRLKGQLVVAHNESFDRPTIQKTMADFGLDYAELDLPEYWKCTCKIYRSKGFNPASLDACCEKLGIELNHHEALSDARGCAELYKRYLQNNINIY